MKGRSLSVTLVVVGAVALLIALSAGALGLCRADGLATGQIVGAIAAALTAIAGLLMRLRS